MMKIAPTRILLYLITGAITLAVSATWEINARLSLNMEYAKYWILSLVYLGGSATILVLMLSIERLLPRLSMKLFQASMSIGLCCYFMPGVATFYSMQFMSPGVAALTIAIVPLWLFIYHLGDWHKKLPPLLICIGGVILFLWGSSPDGVTARAWFILLVLLVSSFLYATGLAFTRRIFWMHNGLELNFWAMGFASCLFALMSFLFYENRSVPELYVGHFTLYVGFLAIVTVGAGTFFYRFVAHHPRQVTVMTLTLGIPLLAMLWAWIFDSHSTPVNFPCIAGTVVVLVALGITGIGESSAAWMTHFLTNTRRVGERVVCRFSCYIKVGRGTISKIDVTDLSIGGLGFNCEDALVVGDRVLVSIPLGEGWTQLSVESKLVHAVKVPDPTSPAKIRWHGGLMFTNIPDDKLQTVVEFLAGMGRHHDHH